MALDDFQMPSFRDPDGTTYIWDSASKSYVKAPLTDKRPDQSHATGGDNDLFDPFQHTEMAGNPLMEGYMAGFHQQEHGEYYYLDCPFCGSDRDYRESRLPGSSGGNLYHCGECNQYSDPNMTAREEGGFMDPTDPRYAFVDEPPFPDPHEVKCPNCGETTKEQVCPTCQKDLTPEWNVQGQENEFLGVHPEFNDAKEWRSWPQVVPKKNEFNYDDSFPSMSLSKTAEAMPMDDGWDDVFSGQAPMRTEVGKWILDIQGQMHIEHGMNAQHESIEMRDQLQRDHEIAVGSVYNDGTADVQAVERPDMLNLDEVQGLLEQAFGAVVLQPPINHFEVQDKIFPPTDIQGGQWFIPPHTGTITGVAFVKERPESSQYQPNMILCAEHLRPEDFELWSKGAAAIITAVGGGASHAAMLAATHNIPVITAIGDSYNKLQTGNYLKIEPTSETITVMPGATSEMPSEQKHQIWNDILDYQRQRGGSVSKPFYLTSYHEEVLATANLEECPECQAPMFDRDGESQCGDCGHKQPVIQAQAKISATITPAYNRLTQENVDALVVYAQVNDKLVGFLTAEPVDGGWVTDYVQVHPSYRRRGIATAMIHKARDLGAIPYASLPSQVYQSEAGKALAASVWVDTPQHRIAKVTTAGKAALVAPLLEGGGAEAGGVAGAGGAGGGMGGIGSLMNSALGRGMAFQTGKDLIPGGGSPSGMMDSAAQGATPQSFDPNAGTVASVQHTAVLSEIWALIKNALQGINWSNVGGAIAANPIDDALIAGGVGGLGAAKQHTQNQLQSFGALGDDNVGLATDNDGTNSTEEASNSGIEGKKEQGDGPEQLKDVDGGHDSQGSNDSDDMGHQGDPHMQEKALKAFHMNLPLVIEFANSEEPGIDNPILQAIDAMLEEAFPGYKDGHGDEGAETEHPQEKESETPEERDDDASEPDAKSEGSDKKEASLWHYLGASFDDYMNEQQWSGRPGEKSWGEHQDDWMQSDMSPGDVIAAYPDGTIVLDDGITTWNMERAQQFAQIHGWSDAGSAPGVATDPQMEAERGFGREAAGGPEAWNMRRTLDGPWDAYQSDPVEQQQQPQFNYAQPPQVQGNPEGFQQGAPTPYSCMNCGEEHMWPANVNPRDLPACPQCGAQSWTRSGVQQTYANDHVVTKWKLAMPANVPAQQPAINSGAQAAPATTCPQCGQNHIPGTPCPTPATNQVQAPGATGPIQAPMSPGVQYSKVANDLASYLLQLGPGKHELEIGGLPFTIYYDEQGAMGDNGMGVPGDKTGEWEVWSGDKNIARVHVSPHGDSGYGNDQAPIYAAEQVAQAIQGALARRQASEDHTPDHNSDHSDYHSDDDWMDESGAPLEEGAQYEMKTAHSPIPTRITIEKIFPEKLTYLIHSGDVDYRDKITRDELEFDGAKFLPVDNTGDDSMGNAFPDEEMPVRPGQDALPQQDDLSVPSTVMSHEVVSLDNYTGSYEGDTPDDRSWLIEGSSSAVEVDPTLMAKMAGKDFSPREQREFIDERGEARNLDRLDLAGTHYIDDELGTSDSLW